MRRELFIAGIIMAGVIGGVACEGSQSRGGWGQNVIVLEGLPETVTRWSEIMHAAVNEALNQHEKNDHGLPLPRQVLFEEIYKDVNTITTIESHGGMEAVSPAGARCAMQLVPQVGIDLNPGESPDVLFDPVNCFFRGTLHYTNMFLTALRTNGGDVEAAREAAVVRYNRGPAGRDAAGEEYLRRFTAARSQIR